MSDFKVEVVQLGAVTKHPNADRLDLTNVYADPATGAGGYTVIFETGQYKEGDLAVFVPVDSVVPETNEWAWLWGGVPNPTLRKRRVKAKRIRGIFSCGMLTGIPETIKGEFPGNVLGLDVAERCGITKYVDPSDSDETSPIKRGQHRKLAWYTRAWRWVGRNVFGVKYPGDSAQTRYGLAPPKLKHTPGHYDIENIRKHAGWFKEGEDVVILEKIHGQNASFVFAGGKLHLKSRSLWRPYEPSDAHNAWARVASRYSLESKLSAVPGLIVYGEAYGNFAGMPYGASATEPGFVAFDAYDSVTGTWLDWDRFVGVMGMLQIPVVPVLGRRAWFAGTHVESYAEGKSILNALAPTLPISGHRHVREGCVIKPAKERTIHGGQRVILKAHGEGFLTRKDALPS